MQNHDLSYDQVKLDFPTMERVASHAIRYCREAMDRDSNHIWDCLAKESDPGVYARSLEQEAKHYAEAIETYFALKGVRTRHDVFIVNRPVITE